MNIYPTNNEILDILQNHKCSYNMIIKRKFPDFYIELTKNSNKRFAELLYLYLNPGSYACKQCGGKDVTFMEITTGYKKYCSMKCLNNSPEHKTGIKKFCSNELNNTARKLKGHKTYKEKTGYDYPMQDPLFKEASVKHMTTLMREKYFVEFRPGLTKKQYTRKCRHFTNTVYKEYKNIIDPLSMRSREFVLDHIYSIFEGWKNNVPFDIICHPSNTRIIPKQENSSKISRCDKTLTELYEDCKCFSVKYLLDGSTSCSVENGCPVHTMRLAQTDQLNDDQGRRG